MKKLLNMEHRAWIAWLLVLPAILLRGITIIYPMITTAWYSLLDYKMISQKKEFIGLGNYVKLFSDSGIRDSIRFTLVFTVTPMAL